MKKADYINNLRFHLSGLPVPEIEDIVRDQEEHIREGLAAGRSEEDVIQSLGDPKLFATSIKAEVKIQQAEASPTLSKQAGSTIGAVFAALALAPLNLIFVLGPFLLILAFMIAGWATSFSLFVSAIFLVGVFFLKALFVSVGFWAQVSGLFFVFGCFGASVLGLLIMYQGTRWFLLGTIAYLKWNLKFIQKSA